MPIFHQYDYLFAFGVIFSSLDAFNIGANDVANSFATSVSSGSLTLPQACLIAAICEFLGAVLVGARVAGTIKNSIIELSVFQGNAGVQLLAFTIAITCSASWLLIATRESWPVSTTYSIVSAIIGVGFATGGAKTVKWGWNGGKGTATIFAGFITAPGIAAGFSAVVYLITKYGILKRKNSLKWALIASPIYFFGVSAILTMSIIYKGAPNLKIKALGPGDLAAAIVGTATVVSILSATFWLPYVYCQVVRRDYTIRWYHFFVGPYLWYRDPPVDAGRTDKRYVPDYRVRKEDEGFESHPTRLRDNESERSRELEGQPKEESNELQGPAIIGVWFHPRNWFTLLKYRAVLPAIKILTHGTTVDVVTLQHASDRTAERINRMHRAAHQYPNETEHLYSFLQIMTACTASFAHGSNDVSNAIAPFAAIYEIWSTSQPVGKETVVPVWMLAYGGACIVTGLATFGYNIMKVLGNRLTLMSPSRGFSMELGSAITVILASQYGIPVSTTMCIVGSTMGVALCNGDIRAFNWRGLAWIFVGWVLTVPIVAVASGLVMAFILNAPHF